MSYKIPKNLLDKPYPKIPEGEKFVVINDKDKHLNGLQKGDVIILTRNDESYAPFFKKEGESYNEILVEWHTLRHISHHESTVKKDEPLTNKPYPFKEGTVFKVIDDGGFFNEGDIITLVWNDNTSSPYFVKSKDYDPNKIRKSGRNDYGNKICQTVLYRRLQIYSVSTPTLTEDKSTNSESEYKVGDWVYHITRFQAYKITWINHPYFRAEFGECHSIAGALLLTDCRKATSDEIKESLLAEAKKRYPIGTKVKCLLGWTDFHKSYGEETGILTDYPEITTINGSTTVCAKGSFFDLFLYHDGKWAEIVSIESNESKSTKDISKEEGDLLAEARRRFPVGTVISEETYRGNTQIPIESIYDIDFGRVKEYNIYYHTSSWSYLLYNAEDKKWREPISIPQNPCKEIQTGISKTVPTFESILSDYYKPKPVTRNEPKRLEFISIDTLISK